MHLPRTVLTLALAATTATALPSLRSKTPATTPNDDLKCDGGSCSNGARYVNPGQPGSKADGGVNAVKKGQEQEKDFNSRTNKRHEEQRVGGGPAWSSGDYQHQQGGNGAAFGDYEPFGDHEQQRGGGGRGTRGSNHVTGDKGGAPIVITRNFHYNSKFQSGQKTGGFEDVNGQTNPMDNKWMVGGGDKEGAPFDNVNGRFHGQTGNQYKSGGGDKGGAPFDNVNGLSPQQHEFQYKSGADKGGRVPEDMNRTPYPDNRQYKEGNKGGLVEPRNAHMNGAEKNYEGGDKGGLVSKDMNRSSFPGNRQYEGDNKGGLIPDNMNRNSYPDNRQYEGGNKGGLVRENMNRTPGNRQYEGGDKGGLVRENMNRTPGNRQYEGGNKGGLVRENMNRTPGNRQYEGGNKGGLVEPRNFHMNGAEKNYQGGDKGGIVSPRNFHMSSAVQTDGSHPVHARQNTPFNTDNGDFQKSQRGGPITTENRIRGDNDGQDVIVNERWMHGPGRQYIDSINTNPNKNVQFGKGNNGNTQDWVHPQGPSTTSSQDMITPQSEFVGKGLLPGGGQQQNGNRRANCVDMANKGGRQSVNGDMSC